MTRKETIVKFISDNDLNFYQTDSSLNSDCTIISGFALHLGDKSAKNIKEALIEAKWTEGIPSRVNNELNRVFAFAKLYNYGNWWNYAEAKSLYTF